MTAQDRMMTQDYGVFANERVAVFIHGPNLFNAHRALGLPSADLMMLREFFSKYCDLFGIHYFNAAPRDPDVHSPVDRLCKFLEHNGFPVHIKWVDMIPDTPFSPPPPPPAAIVTPRRENDFRGGRLSLASARPDLYDLTAPRGDDNQPDISAPGAEQRLRMPRITLTAEIMVQVMRIVLLTKARPHAAIQRVVFIGGEYDYAPYFDLFIEMGVRLTLIGLNKESVSPNGGFIPPYAMVPYSLKQGIPAQFVDLARYLPFIKNEDMERRRAEGQGSGFGRSDAERRPVMVGGRA